MNEQEKWRLKRVMQKMSDRLGGIGFSHPHLSPDDWTDEEKADYQTILSLIDRQPSEEEAERAVCFIEDLRLNCLALWAEHNSNPGTCRQCEEEGRCNPAEDTILKAIGIEAEK